MKNTRRHIVIGLIIVVVIAALSCAPTSRPPQPATSSPAQPATAIGTAPQFSSPEDVKWAKIVEAAKKEGKVNAYDYFMVGDIGVAVSRAFEARYGIKLEMVPARGAETLERLKTERRIGAIVADMLGGSSPNTINMKREGLTEKVSDILPVFREKDVWAVDPLALDPDGHVIGYNSSNINGYINTKLVKMEDAPKSLQDYLKPQWKGKIVASDPTISNSTYITFVPLLNRGIIDMAYIKALGEQNLILDVSPLGTFQKLARGDAYLTPPVSDSTTGPIAVTGAPVQAISLAHGTEAYMSAIAAVKGAPHPNAALVYLNWRMSPEGQAVYGQSAGAGSVRKDVPDFRPPSLTAPAKDVIVVTAKDMDDAAKMFSDKVFVPLLKK